MQLPNNFVIVFDPVTHGTHQLDVKGEPTRERQTLSMVFNNVQTPVGTVEMQPGPLRLSLDNRTNRRVLPALWVAADPLHHLLGKRRPFLTAKRLLTNQTFRDIYRAETLDADQRLKITSLTFLFTDLKGSTALYERVGDLVAYDLVRQHFHVLYEIVAAEAGAIVKTIGDAVMATFVTPDRALAAALKMREAMTRINAERASEDLAAQDRHSRGTLPRRAPQQQPGLFRADREYRRPGARPCLVARHLRHPSRSSTTRRRRISTGKIGPCTRRCSARLCAASPDETTVYENSPDRAARLSLLGRHPNSSMPLREEGVARPWRVGYDMGRPIIMRRTAMDAVTPKEAKSSKHDTADTHSHVVRPAEMEWKKTRFEGCEVKGLLLDK